MAEILMTLTVEEARLIQAARRSEEAMKKLENRAKKAGKSVKEIGDGVKPIGKGLDISLDDMGKKMETSLRNSFLSLFAVGGVVSTAIGLLISDIKKGFAEIDKQIEESGKKARELDLVKKGVASSSPGSVIKNLKIQEEIIREILRENETVTRQQILDTISSININLGSKSQEEYNTIVKKIAIDATKYSPMVSPNLYAQYAGSLYEAYGFDAIRDSSYIVSNIRTVGEENARKVADSLKQLTLAGDAGLEIDDIIALLNANISVTGGTEEALNILKKTIRPEEIDIKIQELRDATHKDIMARKRLMSLSEKDRTKEVYSDLYSAKVYFGQDITDEQLERLKVSSMTVKERFDYYTGGGKGVADIFGAKGITASPVLKSFKEYRDEQTKFHGEEAKKEVQKQEEEFKQTNQYKNTLIEAKKDKVSSEYEERLRKISYLEEMIKSYQQKYPETTRYYLFGSVPVDFLKRDPLTKFKWGVMVGSDAIRKDLTDEQIQKYFIEATDPYRQSARAHMIKGTLDTLNNLMLVSSMYSVIGGFLKYLPFGEEMSISTKALRFFYPKSGGPTSILRSKPFAAVGALGKMGSFSEKASTKIFKSFSPFLLSIKKLEYVEGIKHVDVLRVFSKLHFLPLSITGIANIVKFLDNSLDEYSKGSSLIKMIPLVGEAHNYWMNYIDIMKRNAEKEKELLDIQKAAGFDISKAKYSKGSGLYIFSAYTNPRPEQLSRKELQEKVVYETNLYKKSGPKITKEMREETPDEMGDKRYSIDELKKLKKINQKINQQESNRMINQVR